MKTRVLKSRRAGFLLLFTLLIAYAFICMTRACFNAAMSTIVQMGVFTKTQTGIISAVFYAIYGVLQIVGGMITDHRKPEHLITVGFVGAAISNFVIYFNQNYVVILLAWSFNAAAQFAVWPAIFKLLSTMLPNEMRSNALFATTFVNPAGVVASYLVAAIVSEYWQMNFLVSAVGLTLLAILWEAVAHKLRPDIQEFDLIDPEEEGIPRREAHPRGEFTKIMLASGLFLALAVAFSRTSVDTSIRNLTATMLNESYDSLNPVISNYLSVIVLVCGTIGSSIARLLYPRVIKNEAIAMTLFVSLALIPAFGLLFLGKVNYLVILLLLAIVALLLGATTLFTMTYIAARYSKWGKGATVAGMMNCTASVGVVAANSLSPALADHFSWRIVSIVWIAMLALTLLLSVALMPIWTRFWKKQSQA